MSEVYNEKWKAGKCGGSVVSDTPDHYTTDDSLKFYGGYLVAESIGSERHKRLIMASPEMFRVLENILPVIEAEAEERDSAHADPRIIADNEYYTEMHKAAERIRAALHFARHGVMPEPPAAEPDDDPDDDDFEDLAEQHEINYRKEHDI